MTTIVAAPPASPLAHLRDARAGTLSLLAAFGPDDLAFVPFAGGRSAGDTFLHIAECEDFWLHQVVRGELVGPLDYALSDYPTPDAVLGVLAAARERTERAFGSSTDWDLQRSYETPWREIVGLDWVLWHLLEHEIHHRGELSLMLGMLGREGLDV